MSAVTTQWIVELADRISGPISKIVEKVTAATKVGDKFSNAFDKSSTILGRFSRIANSVSTSVSSMGSKIRDAANDVPVLSEALRMVSNPFVAIAAAGAGLAFAVKKAYDFNEGMAKINATALLSNEELSVLKGQLIEIGKNSGGNFAKIPDSFEAINSVLGDQNLSLEVLKASVDGAKAGFTDLDVVGNAVAKTMSIVGKENTNAQQVIDTFSAAKNVGSGEFQDFANYMPGLIASGKSLSISYQDVAGIFAYMTTQAGSASDATMLISNAFTALGKSDVREKLSKQLGVSLFDKNGMAKEIGSVITEMANQFSSLSPEERAIKLEAVGFTDSQAKSAFNMLFSDAERLNEMIAATNNSLGATERALKATENPSRNWAEAMDKVSALLVIIGDKAVPIVDAAVKGFVKTLEFFENPFVQDVLAGIGNALIILSIAFGVATIATQGLTWAFGIMSFVLSISPLGWILIVVGLLITAITVLWRRSEVFRGAILGLWEVIKGFGGAIKEFVLDRIEKLISGIGSMASAITKLINGDFKGAFEDAKKGVVDLVQLNPLVAGPQLGQKFLEQGKAASENFNKGYALGEDKPETKKDGFSVVKNKAVDANNLDNTIDSPADPNKDKKITGDNKGASSGSGGSSKNITMKLDFKNYFNIDKNYKGDVTQIANEIVGMINDRLRDGLMALD